MTEKLHASVRERPWTSVRPGRWSGEVNDIARSHCQGEKESSKTHRLAGFPLISHREAASNAATAGRRRRARLPVSGRPFAFAR